MEILFGCDGRKDSLYTTRNVYATAGLKIVLWEDTTSPFDGGMFSGINIDLLPAQAHVRAHPSFCLPSSGPSIRRACIVVPHAVNAVHTVFSISSTSSKPVLPRANVGQCRIRRSLAKRSSPTSRYRGYSVGLAILSLLYEFQGSIIRRVPARAFAFLPSSLFLVSMFVLVYARRVMVWLTQLAAQIPAFGVK